MSKLILTNGKIYVDRGHFAQAVYAEDGVIKAVGSESDVRAAAGANSGAEVLDCGGRTVLPGLNDSHCHAAYAGLNMTHLNLSGAKSIDDIVERGRKFLAEHPDAAKRGIQGRGWNEDLFTSGEKRPLNRHDIDRISTDVPIVLTRVCGHSGGLNTKAIEAMGLTKDSPQLSVGVFDREDDGFPTGLFKENVSMIRSQLFPAPTIAEYTDMYVGAADYALSVGLTSVQSNDAGYLPVTIEEFFGLIDKAARSGRAKIRYRHQITCRTIEAFREYVNGAFKLRNDFHPYVAAGPLKLFKDGSLGARTATLRQEYHDDPGNTGVDVISNEVMDQFCAEAYAAGIQVFTHCIGDRAVDDTVRSYIKADPQSKFRNVVNHCQITDRPLLELMAKHGICVGYQPIFLDYDLHITEPRVGHDMASTSYAFGTMAKLGAHVGYGSDWPVEDCNPFPGICCAVTRTDKNNFPEGGWFPQEKVDVETAVDAFTVGSAYIEFREADKGRIKPGWLADMIVLDNDIFTCAQPAIRDIRPTHTIVGGEVVYSR